ncbi:hypothetical protein CYMTET_43459 [Cymbomonas tetramitiformis]|uniref:Uncharacterized protein n=1 Tax=Cymbomonas tetramitiformis TaxID=36881 RepID=A0AAE0C420_9CHLO|nr:hypothetical protein CYMTET_43459 [Cymbomonas tetramitiformis]
MWEVKAVREEALQQQKQLEKKLHAAEAARADVSYREGAAQRRLQAMEQRALASEAALAKLQQALAAQPPAAPSAATDATPIQPDPGPPSPPTIPINMPPRRPPAHTAGHLTRADPDPPSIFTALSAASSLLPSTTIPLGESPPPFPLPQNGPPRPPEEGAPPPSAFPAPQAPPSGYHSAGGNDSHTTESAGPSVAWASSSSAGARDTAGARPAQTADSIPRPSLRALLAQTGGTSSTAGGVTGASTASSSISSGGSDRNARPQSSGRKPNAKARSAARPTRQHWQQQLMAQTSWQGGAPEASDRAAHVDQAPMGLGMLLQELLVAGYSKTTVLLLERG